ncbi:MAG TPA: hypothetical protein VK392_09650, partial [Thermoanaerobaculia bacterium]|nr:hypothetical protein [Thermoanaerobaculia bacterium]
EARTHWSVPAASRGTDFFDAKGLFERLVEPWLSDEELVWRPFAAPAFVAGAAARCETADGHLVGVVGVVGESEREKRRLPEGVSAGEILVESIPREGRPVRFRDYSAFPPIVVDLSFAQPRSIAWEAIEEFTRGLALSDLESLKLLDRYEGPGVAEGQVKTTIRLAFRSPERTLEQDAVNRERDRLAQALREKFGVLI